MITDSRPPRRLASGLRPLAAAAVALAAMASFTACTTPAGEQSPTSIRIGIPDGEFLVDWNPMASAHIWTPMLQTVYEPLVIWDGETESYGPLLAEEYTLSPDAKTIEFVLRQDVDFVDGEHLDAEAVVSIFETMLASGTSIANAVLGRFEPKFSVTSEYTVELTTSHPMRDGNFFIELIGIPLASPAALADPSAFEDGPVGTGPYLVDEIVPDASATFVRNPDYWNAEAFDFDEVTFVTFSDKVAALNALKSGQIDAAALDPNLAVEAEASGLELWTAVPGFSALVVLDRAGEKLPPLADVRVRQAMSMAFDRDEIVSSVESGFGVASSQPFLDGAAESVPGGNDRYPYDPVAARALLAEAGYPDGFTVRINRGGALAGIDYQPIIQSSLAEIGITVEWVNVQDYWAAVKALDIEVTMAPMLYTTVIPFISPDREFTTQPITDPEWIDLVTTYVQGDRDEFAAVQPEIAEYVLEQAWYIPYTHVQVIWATTPEVALDLGDAPDAYYPALRRFSLAE